MNFLEICGVLWLVSVGAGGLWVGLCLLTDWLKRRRDVRERDIAEYSRLARASLLCWIREKSCNEHGLASMAPQAIAILDDQVAHPEWWYDRPAPRILRIAANVLARQAQEAEARDV